MRLTKSNVSVDERKFRGDRAARERGMFLKHRRIFDTFANFYVDGEKVCFPVAHLEWTCPGLLSALRYAPSDDDSDVIYLDTSMFGVHYNTCDPTGPRRKLRASDLHLMGNFLAFEYYAYPREIEKLTAQNGLSFWISAFDAVAGLNAVDAFQNYCYKQYFQRSNVKKTRAFVKELTDSALRRMGWLAILLISVAALLLLIDILL